MAAPMSPVGGDLTEVEPYSMHVSSRYLDLTKRKLELTRMPRQLQLREDNVWALGTPKAALEPLIDYWLESYDWRAQESLLNSSLQQFRILVQSPPPPKLSHLGNLDTDIEAAAATPKPEPESLRMHYLHHRSSSPTAIPLLYCHTWPGSFLEMSRCIDTLVNPIETPTQQPSTQTWRQPISFHVVVPSLPGFGFSDASSKEGFGAKDTADVLVSIMLKLGYERFVVWGDGWGFRVARMLAIHHPAQIAAVYTSNANDLPAPQVLRHKDAWLKYQIARLTGAKLPWLSFGYTSSDFGMADLHIADNDEEDNAKAGSRGKLRKPRAKEHDVELGEISASTETTSNLRVQQDSSTLGDDAREPSPAAEAKASDTTVWRDFPMHTVSSRPQTVAYGLCDSPAGLLALFLDALKPSISYTASVQSQPQPQQRRRSATVLHRKPSPIATASARSSFTPAEVLNWTMMYWLPGPEASLRWLRAAEKEDHYACYSEVPLGISWYTHPTPNSAMTPSHSLRSAKSSQTMRSLSKAPASDNDEMEKPSTEPPGQANASPMWASAIQNLKWVKRRNEAVESGIPAWEKAENVVEDVREYFELGRNEGWLGL